MINVKIIDNFLTNDDFNELCALDLKETKDSNIDVYNNYIDKNGLIKATVIKDTTINRLFKNYHSKAIELLKELNSKKFIYMNIQNFILLILGLIINFLFMMIRLTNY